jgi:drug/metabolite transporter (DMT)-like permease
MALMLWAGAGGAGSTEIAAGAASGGVTPHDVIGDVMAIAAAVCFAGYMLTVAEARASMDTLTLNAIAMAACSATLLPLCLAIGAPLWGYPTGTWLALLYLGLVAQLGAYLGIAYALGHLPATVVSIGLLAQAPFTGLLAAWLLGERLSSLQLAGGALVLAGIYIVTRAGAGSAPAAANRA